MTHGLRSGAAGAALAAILVLGAAAGQAQEACSPENWKACKGKPWVDGDNMETPMGSRWWPHPLWGEGDEAGSTNWYTKPEVLKRALEASTGEKVYKLGHPYTADMPLFGARKFALRIPGLPTGGPFGANILVYNDEYVATEIGQVGTQFDGLGHIGVQTGDPGDEKEMRWYNGATASEMAAGGTGSTGLQKNGIEKLHPIVARGILIDVAAVRDQPMQAGDEITMEDVRNALEAQGMADFQFQPGDALIFRTGWEEHWSDPATFNNGEPGIGIEVARWAAEEVQAGLTGADTWAVEVVPNPDPACAFCVHAFLQARHGIVNQENMVLSELAEDGTYVFTYVYSPVPMAGATGSTGAPIAIK
jgi:kynurenine formamidase